MINSRPHLNPDNVEKDLTGGLGNQQYILKSEKLEYRDFNIYYSRTIDQPISLKNYVIPIDQVSPKVRRLIDEPTYLNTALALADYKIRRSKNNEPPRKSIQAAITNYWNTILFLRTRGIFQLKHAEQDDIDFICQRYSEGGWANVLNINEKIEAIVQNMDKKGFRESVSVYAKKSQLVDSMKGTYWIEKLGFIPLFTLNDELMNLFQTKGRELGFDFTDRFANRFQTPVSGPTDNGVRNLLSFFNHLYLISGDVDKLSFYPFDTPRKTSLKYAQKQSERTGNLGIEEATHILGKAF